MLDLHHAGVAAKVNPLMVKFVDMVSNKAASQSLAQAAVAVAGHLEEAMMKHSMVKWRDKIHFWLVSKYLQSLGPKCQLLFLHRKISFEMLTRSTHPPTLKPTNPKGVNPKHFAKNDLIHQTHNFFSDKNIFILTQSHANVTYIENK
jgi:hypothetical protein